MQNVLVLSIDLYGGIRPEQVVALDVGYRPAAAGSGELLLHPDGLDAILVLLVTDQPYQGARPAVVTFAKCRQSIFGYPNDEAQRGDPRLRLHAYGFFEVLDSPWPQRLEAYNRQALPTYSMSTSHRHFVVRCHESLGEFLAEDVRVEPRPGTFAEAAHEGLRRLLD